jgi:hypothetical protein
MSIAHVVVCQDDAADKTGLLLPDCSYELGAEAMILRDHGTIAVNNDYSLRLDRQLTIKFFKERKLDKILSDIVFYPSPSLTSYYKLTVTIVDLDQTTKGLLPKDITPKITSTHLELAGIRIKKGSLLKVSYAVNFPYDAKIPNWRFQSVYPIDFTDLKVSIPEVVNLETSLEGHYQPDVANTTDATRQVRINNQNLTIKVTENYYQFNQVPGHKSEPFSDNSPGELEHLKLRMISVGKGNDIKTDFAEKQVGKIIETLSFKPDFLLRLSPEFSVKADYDRLIKSVTNPEEKIARIYDLVRRHLTWDRVDSLSSRQLPKIWADKKGNSTELNLTLVKLLQVYGFDAAPLLVSTRANGRIDTTDVAITDFDKIVTHVRLGDKSITLDATAKYCDYPMMPSAILNTTGLRLSMDKNRWVKVCDNKTYYKNNVVLLGHLLGDTSFMTNVYVNSTGYAKAEHIEIYERDSLKGIRSYFEHGNKKLNLKHFIVANEYVDTLPLAQEFDIRMRLVNDNNLCGVTPTAFSVPDTVFTIGEDRRSSINFGYRQQYDLVSEYSISDRYEVYVLPNNIQLSAVNGSVHFEREFHNSTTGFSLRQSLLIDKSYFNETEAAELAKFLKKIENLLRQQVILKKLI